MPVGAAPRHAPRSTPGRQGERGFDLHPGPEPEGQSRSERVPGAVRVDDRAGRRHGPIGTAPAVDRLVPTAATTVGPDDEMRLVREHLRVERLRRIVAAADHRVQMHVGLQEQLAYTARGNEHARPTGLPKRARVPARDVHGIHVLELVPREAIGRARLETRTQRGDRPLAVRVHEHEGLSGGRVPVRGLHTHTEPPEIASGPSTALVGSERRVQRARAGEPRELDGRHGPASARYLPGIGRMHDVSRARHLLDAAELDPLDVTHDRGAHPGQCGILEVVQQRRLTSFSHGAGCGCKLGPADLETVLGQVSLPEMRADVLVDTDTGDDAAVVRQSDGQALVATLDFFTPIVDDPYDWGRIAATNAFSDVYAMGARPFVALNIVSWPVDDLPLQMLGQVLQGGIDVASKVGAAVLGGHTITDPEPKYGMVALGLTDPERIVRNSTAPPEAHLFLTKPLGIGIATTAHKRGIAEHELLRSAVEVMTTPNDAAAEAMVEVGAEAATDVTGFGLLGHLQRMLAASGVGARIDASAVPVLPGVLDLAMMDVVPGGTRRNHAFVRPSVQWGRLSVPEQLVLADAQTSGGLLIAALDHEWMAEELSGRGIPWADVGVTVEGRPGTVAVTGKLGVAPI